jgi:K+-transporting ATPase KdpF subunit
MEPTSMIAAILAGGLLIYLLFAMLYPERFS